MQASGQGLPRSNPLVCLALLFVLLQPYSFAQQPTAKPQEWREDLRVLSTDLPRLHANLFFQVPQEVFYGEIAALDHDIPSLSDDQIIIRMTQIVALVGDSHTNLSLAQSRIPFHVFPLRLQWFSDGIFVTLAGSPYRSALGCKLVRIGDTDIRQVYEEVGKLISHENEPWRQYMSQSYLVIPEVLWALGFAPSKEEARFVFQNEAGEVLGFDLPSMAPTEPIDWVTALDHRQITPPIYLKNFFSGFTYWAEYLSDSKLVYLKYNQCRNDAGLPFQYLADELRQYIHAGLAERVVIDVRNNTGGDASVIGPLYGGLLADISAGLIHAANISVIIGRQTASSGMLNAWHFKKIGARLVGEPTGGKPNSYGEVYTLTLPRSGIGISYSTKFVQMADIDTPSLMPDAPAVLSSNDYLQGRDPALENILDGAPATSSVAGFVLYKNGGLFQATAGKGLSAVAGYGSLFSRNSDGALAGLAIFSARKGGVTVSETAVPASAPVSSGRIYADLLGSHRTGIAFANPSEAAAELNYYFTDSVGNDLNRGTIALGPRMQFARFLDQEPFNGGDSFVGTFSWTSNTPLAAMALREEFEDDNESMTALPVARIEPLASQTQVLAHFADGGGWKTQVVLVNTTDTVLKGSLEFFGQGSGEEMAQPVEVTVNGVKGSRFSYDLPPRSARPFSTEGLQSHTQSGSVWIVPAAGDPAPSAQGIFTYKGGGKTITMAGVVAVIPDSRFRIYAELSGGSFKTGDSGSTMTGIAVSNVTDNAVVVNLVLRRLDGTAAKMASLPVSPRGQRALFLNQIPEFSAMSTPQQRVLEVSPLSGSIAVTGLRSRINEKGEFLIAATPPLDEDDGPGDRVFPHIVDGGGYSTQIVLISSTNQNATGRVQFFSQSGRPWGIVLR